MTFTRIFIINIKKKLPLFITPLLYEVPQASHPSGQIYSPLVYLKNNKNSILYLEFFMVSKLALRKPLIHEIE